MNGIITESSGGLYTVLSQGERYDCRARGVLRHKKSAPLVGDRCVFSADEREGFIIESLCERKNSLIRPPIANIDTLIISFAAKAPTPSLLYIDKLVSVAVYNNITPVIVITKADLDAEAAENYKTIYEKANLKVFVTSANENKGIDALRDYIVERNDQIFAFAGSSGIGKSSLLNVLFPSLSLKTGEISEKIERGKHTTRSVSLFPLENLAGGSGFIADTPGFSMLDFLEFNFFPLEALVSTFPEFAARVGECRWRDCSHTKEDGCLIRDAVASGEIAESRHESYLEMRKELMQKDFWKT